MLRASVRMTNSSGTHAHTRTRTRYRSSPNPGHGLTLWPRFSSALGSCWIAQEEVKRIQSVPLVIGQFLEAVDANTGVARQPVSQHEGWGGGRRGATKNTTVLLPAPIRPRLHRRATGIRGDRPCCSRQRFMQALWAQPPAATTTFASLAPLTASSSSRTLRWRCTATQTVQLAPARTRAQSPASCAAW